MIKIDYLIQVTSIPQDLLEASKDETSDLYHTYKIYKRLVDSNLLWRVWLIDEYEKIWVEVNFMNDEGEPEFHTIAIDEGTYLKINFDNYHALNSLD